ncbi:MAG: 23S rRNA (guanosine(2251)-2'-O)-methyltransferase RlmB [Eubacteriaceae bacterium]|nr:23S rRNA (guanosine(2251)-2'-O)-methyltransferase RlmB [Eubacteriaceae bacterium]
MSESEFERIIGRNPIREALSSGRTINRILIAKGATDGALQSIAYSARDKGVEVHYTDRRKLDALTGGASHQGVLAYCSPVRYVEPEDILAIAAARSEKPFIVLLDSITDPYNVGAIIRSAYCAGCHGVIVAKRRAPAISDVVEKASAGSVEHIAVAQAPNLAQTLEMLKKRGVFAVAADKGGEIYSGIDYDMPLVVVIGSEGSGVGRLVKSKCDFVASIPMMGALDSLNCSVAAGIVLFEAAKSRRKA